jgi:hypothetical protein
VNDSQDTSQTDHSLGKGIWIVLALILVIFGVYSFWIAPLIPDNKYDPLSALFSGLAFWGVIYAILLQKSELTLQRKELELTRGEVRGQKEQLEAQNLTLRQQRFENTFFSLLDLYVNIVNSMTTESHHGLHLKGRECFTYMVNELRRQYKFLQEGQKDWQPRALCDKAWSDVVSPRYHLMSHYFRTLFNIFQFIDVSDICDKQTYYNFIRAQLSSPELTLLFYTSINPNGSEKFKPLIQKYGILDTMAQSAFIDPTHKELFD